MSDLTKMKIEFTEDGLVKATINEPWESIVRYLTFEEFLTCMMAARSKVKIEEDKEIVITDTPVLPANNIQTIFHRETNKGYRYVCMVREAKPFDLEYYETIFKNVGMPKLLFMVKIFRNVIQSVYVGAVKDTVVTEETIIYRYPFSNVSGIGSICFGGNRMSEINIESLTSLHSVPNMFLAMPNSDHGYSGTHNLSSLAFRPLLEALEGKPFNEEWLKPMSSMYNEKDILTFSKWLNNFK